MSIPSKTVKNLPTWFILFIAALNGLFYLFLVPPWEHNDEPGNFEYAWLLANMGGKRDEWIGKTDQQMRRKVASSMMEQGFFKHHPADKPNLIVLDQDVWIGVEQTRGLPLYFWLVSLPLRLFRYTDIVFQLYVGRGVSLVLLLLTVYIVIQFNRELGLSEAWGNSLPLLFALFPSFVDKMTAINDDVGAVAFFTLFLWFCTRLLRKGLTVFNWTGFVTSIALCVFTKRNVWISVPIGVLVLIFALFPHWKVFRLGIVVFILLVIPINLLSFDYLTPAFFYSLRNQQLSKAQHSRKAIAGKWVAYLPPGKNLLLYQSLSGEKLKLLGSRIRVGYWLWGKGESSTSLIKIKVNGNNTIVDQPIFLSWQPSLIQHTISIPDSIEKIAVEVNVATTEEVEIYLDCLFLVPDIVIPSQSPTPVDPNCRYISFGDSIAENMIRNGSFEHTWPRLQPWLEKWVDEKFAFSITNLWSVLDVDVGLPYLRLAGRHVFNTFWGRFGWGSVPLLGKDPYLLFWIVTAIILVGNLIALVQSKGKIAWDLGIVFFGSAAFIVIMTLFRHGGNWIWYEATPNARYLMPAFLPLGLFIINGISVLFHRLRLGKIKPSFQNSLWLGILIVYNVWAAISIWSYYVPIRR